MSKIAAALTVLAFGAATNARPHDRWEYVAYNSTDDDISTLNFLQHGTRQLQHDLHFTLTTASIDHDWYALKTVARHSYEARVNGGIMFWNTTSPTPGIRLSGPGGEEQSIGEISEDDASTIVQHGGGPKTVGLGMTLRWWTLQTGSQFLHVNGDPATQIVVPEATYDISFRDTTYTVPRWNNSGSQVSIFVIQNTTPYAMYGEVHLFDATGTLLWNAPFNLAPRGLHVLNTATIAALAGKSGSALIPNRGGYGALAGKVVSVEASTGFTFDTPIAPIPY